MTEVKKEAKDDGRRSVVPLRQPRQRKVKSALYVEGMGSYIPSRDVTKFRASEVFSQAKYQDMKRVLAADDIDALLKLLSISPEYLSKYTYYVFVLGRLVPLFTADELAGLDSGKKPPICKRLMEELDDLYPPVLKEYKDAKLTLLNMAFVREFISDAVVDYLSDNNPDALVLIASSVQSIFTAAHSRKRGETPIHDFDNVVNFLGEKNIEEICTELPGATVKLFPWVAYMMAYFEKDFGRGGAPRGTEELMNKLLIIELMDRDTVLKAIRKDPMTAIGVIDTIQSLCYPVSEIEKLGKMVDKNVDALLALGDHVRENANPLWGKSAAGGQEVSDSEIDALLK